ncbi:MAG: 30S ribosomal protein S2 [Planctomycetota bacterium]|nr:30S ribosomal protein S2 [Planctomycetota bacterium]
MSEITVDKLLENGVHFGHRVSRWNPKMKPYIHGKRNTIHIIDLKETVRGLVRATHYLQGTVAEGGKVLWVGTKRSAKEAVRTTAQRTKQPFVTERWLGGTLTNFRTIRSRLSRLEEIEEMETSGILDALKKKEQARIRNERKKLLKNLEGIRDMHGLPACLVVVDPKNEHIAVAEANKMQIPVIAVLDTDCDPDVVDVPIPGNDDAMRSVHTLLDLVAVGVEEGAKVWAVIEAEQERAAEVARREQEQKREQERQRRQVTEEWQRRLREDAEAKRGGGSATATAGDEPKAEAAPAEEPKAEEPKADEPKADEPKGDA